MSLVSNVEPGERSLRFGRTINVAEAALKYSLVLRMLRIKSRRNIEGRKIPGSDKQWVSQEISPESVINKPARFFCRYVKSNTN